MKRKLNITDIQIHKVDSPIPKRRNGGVDRNGNKGKSKTSRVNIKILVPGPAPKTSCGVI